MTAANAAAVNFNGIKTLLANGLITFFIKQKLDFSDGWRSLTRNLPKCTSLDSWDFI